MRVAFLISHLQHLGPVNVLHAIVGGLLDAGIYGPADVAVVTLSPERARSRIGEFKALGVEVRHVGVRGRSLAAGAVAVRRALRELKPDVCHAHCVKADTLLAVAAVGLPVGRVSTIHNIPSENLADLFPGVRGRLAAAGHYTALRLLRGHLVGCSPTVTAHLRRRLGREVLTVHNPVTLPAGSDPAIVRSTTRLVSAGVSELKRTRRVLELFQASPRCYAMHLALFGDGPLRHELTALHRDDRITWPGYSMRLGAEFQAAAAFVSASASEGMPLAPMEALLCGCPCVLSDIPQHRDVARLWPARVALFDPGSQASFDAALERALAVGHANGAELGALAEELSPSRAAREYACVYEAAARDARLGRRRVA